LETTSPNGWKLGYAIKDHTAQTVADIVVTEFICRYGVPYRIHTDQGREFESELFSEMCSLLGILKSRTTPYRPQSDGMVEQFNRTLQQMLCMFINKSDWDDHLPYVLMAYRSSIQESTKCTPNLLMLGREVPVPIDVVVGKPLNEIEEQCPIEYIEWMRQAMNRAYQCAFENLHLSFEKQKKYHDRNTKTRKFDNGELVWKWSIPKSKRKLSLGWTGPYEVIQRFSDVTYEIREIDCNKTKIVHVDHLKICKSDHEFQSVNDVEGNEKSQDESVSPLNKHIEISRYGRQIRKPNRYGLCDCNN
jgi:hypothetical protein